MSVMYCGEVITLAFDLMFKVSTACRGVLDDSELAWFEATYVLLLAMLRGWTDDLVAFKFCR